jgi:hypothetical protein
MKNRVLGLVLVALLFAVTIASAFHGHNSAYLDRKEQQCPACFWHTVGMGGVPVISVEPIAIDSVLVPHPDLEHLPLSTYLARSFLSRAPPAI